MLIPKPRTLSHVRDIDAILLAETHSEADLKFFKNVVRAAYRDYLDLSTPYYNQEVIKRHKFKQHVLERDVNMGRYSEQWPTDVYAHMWGRYTRWKGVRTTRKEQSVSAMLSNPWPSSMTRPRQDCTRAKHGIFVDVERIGTSRRRLVEYIGKPPPFVISEDAWQTGTPSNQTDYTHSMRRPSPLRVSSLFTGKDEHEAQVVGQSSTPENLDETKRYPSPCAICGYLPPISREICTVLHRLFSDAVHIIPSLANSGLVHDRHLALLASLDKRGKQDFCYRLPRKVFSALELATITDRLVNNSDLKPMTFQSTPSSPWKLPRYEQARNCTEFQWPNKATKALLHTSPNILPVLKSSMGLDADPALFSRIIEAACRHGRTFIEKYKPLSQTSAQRLSRAVRSVLEEEPYLSHYEDAWPVRFYLQRRAKDPEQHIILEPGRQSASASASLTNTSIAAQAGMDKGSAFTAQLSTCPIHLPPDLNEVSEVIKSFFAKSSMEELVVPLALNGVTNEEQFALFRSLDPAQMEQLVTRTDHATKASLNIFQVTMLKRLLHG